MAFASTGPGSSGHLDCTTRSRTWQVTTTNGHTTTGYLPAWADEDPSRTGVPVGRLGKIATTLNCPVVMLESKRRWDGKRP